LSCKETLFFEDRDFVLGEKKLCLLKIKTLSWKEETLSFEERNFVLERRNFEERNFVLERRNFVF
jgi:hypothetical protein